MKGVSAGIVVGRFTVLEHVGCGRWLCKCTCGTEKTVHRDNLGTNTFSCGCLLRDTMRKHGQTGGPEYRAWRHILDRCRNPKSQEWHNYGARGIGVHEGWLRDFGAFMAHVGPRPSANHQIDRIDNDRGYEPGNVRWVTRSENCRNTRVNRVVEFRGKRMTLAEAIELSDVHPATVRTRIFKGWSVERALTEATHGA